ncbi:MAG TPA: cyclopropane-fatty-acyl-phospholipid synthase family protein [Acidimicrobiia bacterium]|nr:cyclopropane-fatty-acyl-phospholipid synthase family protein [Acidimicrobiia bacterium]
MSALESAGLWVFSRLAKVGHLELTLPTGVARHIGSGSPSAQMTINHSSAVPAILRSGLLGFADAHIDGRIDTPSLPGLIDWGLANQTAWFEHPISRATGPLRKVWQRVRLGRRHPRVRTMSDHYDLGNDFYDEWLDETMTYSSARFSHPDQPLAEAQTNKYRSVADHAGLRPGMRVLEIGCGWGGFAEYAASIRDCSVVGITLSTEQADYARKRIEGLGLSDRVDIQVQDFREIDGEFDAVVSIEMIESIDETQWPALFATIARTLASGATAAMQVITIDDDEWERYRSRADFIQQYIFPGGQLPAPKVLRRLAAGAGLEVDQIETFGLDYARTLTRWRHRFEQAWPTLSARHALDERFRRMWELYLTLCEAGFRMGRINVEQWVFSHRPVAGGTSSGSPT